LKLFSADYDFYLVQEISTGNVISDVKKSVDSNESLKSISFTYLKK